MKNKIISLLVLLTLSLALVACGGTKEPPQDSSSNGAITQPASSPQEHDLEAVVSSLSDAASLGDTIDVMEIDLTSAGVDADNIVNFAGAESKLSTENGGIVIVIEAKAGTGAQIAQDLEVFKETKAQDDRYAEFEQARLNTQNARIETKDDLVLYVVDASGTDDGLAQVDSAIAAILNK